MGRAPCCDKANVKKGPWSPEEDAKLKAYIQQNGTGGNWIALPHKIGLKRCGKSCRLRWLNYLRPNIKHGAFTEDEDNIICSLYVSIGSRWSIIAAQLPGRTDNDIKNYWNTKLKKKLLGKQRKQQLQTHQPHPHHRLTHPSNDNNNNMMMMLNINMNQTSTTPTPTPSWSPNSNIQDQHHQPYNLTNLLHHHQQQQLPYPLMTNMFEGFDQSLELDDESGGDYYRMLMLELDNNESNNNIMQDMMMSSSGHVTNNYNNGSSTTTTTSTESCISWGGDMTSLLYSPTLLPPHDHFQAPHQQHLAFQEEYSRSSFGGCNHNYSLHGVV